MAWKPSDDWVRYPTGSPLDLAWAAGLFDGEGSTTCTRKSKKGNPYVRLSMTSTEPELLDRFHLAVGSGARCNAFRPSYNGAKLQYAWHTSSRSHAEHAIAVLWPYLSRYKREQAETAFGLSYDVPLHLRKVI